VLLDRHLFHLDGAAFRRFSKALDAPPTANPRLRKQHCSGMRCCAHSVWPRPSAFARCCCMPCRTKRSAFYVHHGVTESPVDPMTRRVFLADVEQAIRR
jgi:hypothetical protein